jgi:REP element-mobilizing transposase RayT
MRVRREIGRLRGKRSFRAIRAAFIATCRREHFRITDWSVQGNHLHLVAEASSAEALSRGIQGFAISAAKRLNGVLGRRGAVFADRYHSRILRTPREVRNCLSYVMLNARRHGVHRCPVHPDVLSSWECFDGWRKPLTELLQLARAAGPPSAAEPRTWLRRVGWRRRGLICASEAPGGHRARAR